MCYLSSLKLLILRTALHISELLYSNDCVIIPGLGGFVANTRSAFLNPAQHTFSPPSRKLAFNASLRTNDGLLAHHISSRSGITYGEALTEINHYVDDIIQRLGAGEQVWIDKIGGLTYDKENRIQFEPDVTENYLTDAFGLSTIHSLPIRREEATSVKKLTVKKTKKSRQGWRLLELIPAAAVLAILAFNPKIVQHLNTGLAEIIPVKEIFHSPDITVPEKNAEPSVANVAPGAAFSEVVPGTEAPADSSAISGKLPDVVPADSTKVEPVVVEEKAIVEDRASFNTGTTFHIIGGCFRVEENAQKLIEEASLLGYEATSIGLNEKGLHVVSLYSSGNMKDIQEHLTEIQNGFEKGAWVLVK